MNCPQCKYPNPQGVTYCQMCYEVFNRSAADRYLHAQKRARMQREGGLPETPAAHDSAPAPTYSNGSARVVSTKERVDWARVFSTLRSIANQTIGVWLRQHQKPVLIVVGSLALLFAILWGTTPTRRFQIFGSRLDFAVTPKSPTKYLAGLHCEWRTWSERDGRLDTPLETEERNEMGMVELNASRFIRLAGSDLQDVSLQPREWIISQGAASQAVPLNHPSVKAEHLSLNRKGRFVNRAKDLSPRLGRVSSQLFPRWDNRVRKTGDAWEEPVEWVGVFGDWKINWKGKMHWRFEGMETHQNVLCLKMSYRGDVAPSLWATPDWAKGAVHRIFFNGTTSGTAFFDQHLRQIAVHDFRQSGTLSIPISNIYRIPPELRVGRTPRRNQGAEPGRILIQFQEKFDTQKS
jgi:hypothetical protein